MTFNLCLVILNGDVVIRYAAVLLMPRRPGKSRICVPQLFNELPMLVSLFDNVLKFGFIFQNIQLYTITSAK